MKVLAERMDVGTIVTSCGNVNLLSNVLMEPYQMKIISQFKKSGGDETKLAYKISIDQAIEDLHKNLRLNKFDKIHKKVDEFLLKLLEN